MSLHDEIRRAPRLFTRGDFESNEAWLSYCEGFTHAIEASAALALKADARIADLESLAHCGCGDGFTAHDPGTCGNCVAGMSADTARFAMLCETSGRDLCFMGQSYPSADEFRAAIDAYRSKA